MNVSLTIDLAWFTSLWMIPAYFVVYFLIGAFVARVFKLLVRIVHAQPISNPEIVASILFWPIILLHYCTFTCLSLL